MKNSKNQHWAMFFKKNLSLTSLDGFASELTQYHIKYDYIIDLGLKFHKGGRLPGLAISSGWPGTGWLADSCLEF